MNDISEKIHERLEQAIEDKIFPGAVCGVVCGSGERRIIACGSARYGDPDGLREDAVFDVASVTKIIPTAALVSLLVERGDVLLDEPARMYAPELGPAYEKILIRHLLEHTAGYDPCVRLSEVAGREGAAGVLEFVRNPALANPPGSRFAYSNAASIALGFVAEQIFGAPLDVAAEREFFQPLGMHSTTFRPAGALLDRIVPSEIGPDEAEVRGIVHDESARVLFPERCVGSAGLFSTAGDMLTFLETLVFGGRPGLGWEACEPRWMGRAASPSVFGKTGFTGCSVLVCPERGTSVVLLSNCTYPKRKPDSSLINGVRRDVADYCIFEF